MSSTIERKLAAIMFTDIAGYTSQMSKDEAIAINLLNKKESILKPLIDKHNGEVPQTYEELEALPAVGHKTAAVVLSQAFEIPAFPVDTHILRISKRLEFVPPNCTAENAHRLLPDIVPEGKAYPFHLNLITFGRQICNARKPKCDQCLLTAHCLYFRDEL